MEGLKEEVREAVSGGRNVQEMIREITLKALRERELDHAALGRVTQDVLAAVREAAQARGGAGAGPEVARSMREAVDGLDQALATAAQAVRLSLEEAAGRVEAFSRNELAGHLRATSEAMGRELDRASPLAGNLARATRAQLEAGVGAAAASGAMLARIASGVFAGVADALSRRRDGPR